MYSNYHTHSQFCDGKDLLESYVIQAVKRGIDSLGFSSHAPLSYKPPWAMKIENIDEYISTINCLKDKYKDKIQIYFGFELDYVIGYTDEIIELVNKYKPQYTIGAVHLLGTPGNSNYLPITGDSRIFENGLKNAYNGDIRYAVEEYYRLLLKMHDAFKPDIIAHLDLIKKVNVDYQLFDDESIWHNQLVNNALEYFSKNNSIIEINTGALTRKKARSLFPSDFALLRIKELGIPITVNSDSHLPEDIAGLYPETIDKLKKIGFKNVMRFNGATWNETAL